MPELCGVNESWQAGNSVLDGKRCLPLNSSLAVMTSQIQNRGEKELHAWRSQYSLSCQFLSISITHSMSKGILLVSECERS